MARRSALAAVLGLTLIFASGGADAASAQQASWTPVQSTPGIVDLAGPRTDGRLVVAMGGGLQMFNGGGLIPLTHPTGASAYVPTAGESYLAMATQVRLPRARCSFHRDDVFAIGDNPDRIVRIKRNGDASDFAALPSPFLSAITFDRVGTFGHRLLVFGHTFTESTLFAIDCRGRVKTLTEHAPIVEGGMAVAPKTFGSLRGRLIALSEIDGSIYAVKPNGSIIAALTPPLPAGADVGLEALAFVPNLKPNGAAFLADHGMQGMPFTGTDSILRMTAAQLSSAGVRAGDLLVAREGGAETIDVRCPKGGACTVNSFAAGPAVTHSEGHIAFLGVRTPRRPKRR